MATKRVCRDDEELFARLLKLPNLMEEEKEEENRREMACYICKCLDG